MAGSASRIMLMTSVFAAVQCSGMNIALRTAMWADANTQREEVVDVLADALDAPGLEFTTGGDAEWTVQNETDYRGGSALKSGAIGDDQKTWVETSVTGAGEMAFWWKASSESFKQYAIDYAVFYVDGVERLRIGGEVDWRGETVEITGGGVHTLRWAYVKDSQDSSGSDCAWLDSVAWTPNEVANVAVDGEKGRIAETADGYVVTAKEGKVLTEADFAFGTVPNEAYKIEIAEGGRSATVTLAVPVVGVAPDAAEEAAKDEDDPSGMLVEVAPVKIAAKPEPKSGETVGALPVKAYEGLYYQAAWGSDITGMTTGEKVKATGRSLYLGVIKQKGEKGFYKLTVSEK
ncbi:MAG: hypothetical protein J6P13_00355 [Kiritimatiellae bacterium]|nr:hypothetical protein [Kiritimatiellia bacterium]